MLELVNNYYTVAGSNGETSWLDIILNIFVAGGTIASAVGAFYAGRQAKNAAKEALDLQRKAEEDRDKEKKLEIINKKLSLLKGLKAELFLEQNYFSYKKDHINNNRTPLYRDSKITTKSSFYLNNINNMTIFEDEKFILNIQKCFMDIKHNYGNLSLIRELAVEFAKLETECLTELNPKRIKLLQKECKEKENSIIKMQEQVIKTLEKLERELRNLFDWVDIKIKFQEEKLKQLK